MPLKYLSNFWRSLRLPLINCKIKLKLKWTKYYVLSANSNDNVLVYLSQDVNSKRFKAKIYYLPKYIIKNYNVIINRKNFCDKFIEFTIKWSEEIRKLATEQGEDYTTGCL